MFTSTCSRSVGWLALIWLLTTQLTNAQVVRPDPVCGTPAPPYAQMRELERQAAAIRRVRQTSAPGDISYVPIRPHIFRRSNGTGGMSLTNLNNVLALTNRYYLNAGTSIQFYFAGTSPDYVDDDALYASFDDTKPPADPSTGADEVKLNGRDATNAMNMYIVDNFLSAGLGGYAHFPDDAIRHTRVFILNEYDDDDMGNRLVPHELGHCFNLLHTHEPFYGTELVTRGGGANCTTAGDLVCDTPADPYGLFSGAGSSCVSGCPPTYTCSFTDSQGNAYAPSPTNIMSYYFPCSHDFTAGQYNRMIDGLAIREGHSSYSLDFPSTAVNAPTNVFAVSTVSTRRITWQDNASNEMGYFIERSTLPGSGFVPVGGVGPNETQFTDFNVPLGTVYYYRIRPSNSTGTIVNAITLSITGNEDLCNTGTYTISSGAASPVNWAVIGSPASVTPTSGTGNTAVLTALPTANNSYLTLRFTVGSGGSAVTLDKPIYATYTPAPSMTTAAGQATVAPGQTAVTVQQFTGNVLFSADNCVGGVVNWSGGGLSGTGLLVAPTSSVGTVTYTSTCTRSSCTGPASTVTVTVTAGPTPLLVITPAFNCSTGLFTFQTAGGDGTPIEFMAIGITGWTPVPQHIIAANLRNDATLAPFTLMARQSGKVVQISWDLRAFCSSPNLTPLLIDNPIPNLTGTVGQLFQYTIPANTFRDPDGQLLTYSATGLPIGLGLTNGTISGIPSTMGVFNAVVTATDPGGRTIGTGFTITIDPAPGSSTALQMAPPTYVCATGNFTFRTTGGNGAPIEFMAVGIAGWSTTANYTLPLSLRTDSNLEPFTLMARQGSTVVTLIWDLRAACTIGGVNQPPTSTTIAAQIGVVGQPYTGNMSSYFSDPDGQALVFSATGLPAGLVMSSLGVISGTPTTAGVSSVQITAADPSFLQTTQTFFFTVNPASPVVGALTLMTPLYNCETGQFVFRALGGNGTPIEFRSVGITDWTTNVNHVVSPVLINEPGTQPFQLQARQGGVITAIDWNLRLACSAANLPPIQLRPIPPQTATVGQLFTLNLTTYFGDPESLALQYSLNPPGGTIGGLTINSATGIISGIPTAAGLASLGIKVADVNGSNLIVSIPFVISPAPVVPVSPALQLIAPAYVCATRQLTFATSGGDGTPIEFMAIGVTNWSNSATHTVEAGVTADLSNSTLTLMARQSGVVVSYVFNFRTACPVGIRQGVAEPAGLLVTVLGNPVRDEAVELDIQGAEGKAVRLQLADVSGHVLSEQTIEQAGATERVRMRLGKQAGVYIVQVSADNERKTVRVVRQ